MNAPRFRPWPNLNPGDQILIRNRRTAHELVTIVDQTLPPLEGEGAGIRDRHGRTIRHHFYDIRPIRTDPTIPDQHEIDRRFAEITTPDPRDQ